MATLLTVDDEPGIRAFIAETLASEGHEVVQAADGDAALELLADRPFDAMILDLRMPGAADGMTVLRRARAEYPAMQVILLTAFGTVPEAVEAMRIGAFDFLQKPIESPAAVRRLVARALAWRGSAPVGGAVRTPAPGASPGAAAEGAGEGRLRRLLREMQRRHVYQAAATYAAVAFIALQVGELVLPVLPLPSWSYAGLVALALVGLPVVVALGWIYDVSLTRTGHTAAAER